MVKPSSGILLVDKPIGISSQSLVSRVKRILQVKCAGHTGTLDPIATGLNIICYGRATRVSAYLTACDKSYLATLQLGLETDTGDTTGEALFRDEVPVSEAQLREALGGFIGKQMQVPPAYSAISLGGQRAYKLARKGEVPEIPPREITIYGLELVSYDGENRLAVLNVDCSKGTYIRSLCRDIGRALGTYGTMAGLRRTKMGRYDLKDAHTLEQLAQACEAKDYGFVKGIDAVFADLPAFSVNGEGFRLIRNGAEIPAGCAVDTAQGRSRIYDENGTFIGVGIIENETIRVEKRFYEV